MALFSYDSPEFGLTNLAYRYSSSFDHLLLIPTSSERSGLKRFSSSLSESGRVGKAVRGTCSRITGQFDSSKLEIHTKEGTPQRYYSKGEHGESIKQKKTD